MFGNKNQKISLLEGSAGEIQAGKTAVYPESRAVQLGGNHWGWVWNRPHRLIVRHGEQERILPIINLNRWIQMLLYGAAAVFGILGVLLWKRTKKEVPNEG